MCKELVMRQTMRLQRSADMHAGKNYRNRCTGHVIHITDTSTRLPT